jgi:hypothetical protein
LFLVVDNNCRVIVESDMRAVGSSDTFFGSYDNRFNNVAFFYRSAGSSRLNSRYDNVADITASAERSAHNSNTLDFFCARIVRNSQSCFRLYHYLLLLI